MRFASVVVVSLLAFASQALAAGVKPKSACGEGQVRVRGACAAQCSLEGVFANPNDCECPPGYGKVLLGTGGGQCSRLTCQKNVPVDPKLCDCPAGHAKKALGKGRIKCVVETAGAPTTPKAKAK